MSDYDAAFAAAAKPAAASPYDDIMKNLMSQTAVQVPENAPAVVKTGAGINNALGDAPRQLGLTARYGLEGLANTAQIFTEPIRNAFNGLRNAVPMLGDSRYQSPLMMDRQKAVPTRPLGEVATSAADALRLPQPQGPTERVIGDATRLVAGAGGMGAAARSASALPGLMGQAGEFLSANMGSQLSSAAGAGLLGGSSREAGGTPLQQGGAALVGGVLGGFVPGASQALADAGKRLMTKAVPALAPSSQQIDVQINGIMERAGVDYSQIPERVRQSLRQDLAQALSTGGELDPAAVRRLADFRMTGLTPTRGAITQDPVQITREMNLAKTGANSADGQLQGLARVQNQNNTRLINNLNEAGAAQGDPFRAGQSGIAGIRSQNSVLEGAKNRAYDALEGMPGYRAPMGANPISNINAALGEEASMPFMPKEISSYMESFLAPNAPPFTPQAYNNLQKMLSRASMSQDGNVRHAVSVAMRALERTPVTAGNSVPTLEGPAIAGHAQDAISQLRVARAANHDWRTWQESSPPISAAVGGAQPDKFFKQFVLDGTVADAQAFAQHTPREVARNAILAHVKEKALGQGVADEVGKVSQSAFNKALDAIGERKLAMFFTPQELSALRANARVASYVQVQPVGSAVNNSNTGALLLGKGLDALGGFANAIPGFGPLVSQPLTNGLRNLNVSIRQQQAQNIVPGLLATQPRAPLGQSLLLPGIAAGGLLASP